MATIEVPERTQAGPGRACPAASSIPRSSDELDRSRRFGSAEFRRYEWDQSYTAAAPALGAGL